MDFKNLRVAMHNLGCKVNSYEAEAMVQELRTAGAEIVPWEDFADIYIINTCSVTNIADRKSRQMLHKAKLKNPEGIVVGAGCYVQARAEELQKDSAVDILVGNNRKGSIVEVIREYMRAKEENDALHYVPDIRSETGYETLQAGESTEHQRAFLKVQDGCNQFCSYCIIPYVRGRIRSRSLADTLQEVQMLAAKGFREVVLTGIHISSYGLDFENQNYEYAMNHEIPSEHLLTLIESVAAVPGIERVRLGSLEPRIITEAFTARLAAVPELCPHFHLSLQSGCDRTLKAMNRHYDTAAFRESVRLLREAFPDAAVTTDVIVGFPGETEEDFRASYDFISEIGFYELHVFKYSRRQGTVADRMPGQLTDKEKSVRSEALICLDKERSAAFRTRFLDRTEAVLAEEIVEYEGGSYLTGFSKAYVKYLIPFRSREAALGKIGEIISVRGVKICDTYVLAETPEML